MAALIWDKGDSEESPDERIMRFLAGRDVVLDRELFLHDIRASKAHVNGLARISVINCGERDQLVATLDDLALDFQRGAFVLDDRFEDGHSAIEARLIERLGETGKKVHTGRSRNDQIAVATRMYLRDSLDELQANCCEIAHAFVDRAAKDAYTPMPGYTHLQRAVPSSVGLWLAAFAEAFIDNAELSRLTRDWINTSPLGTAAGYGVNLPLDREEVAKDLGFERVQLNPMYAQNSRGTAELQALAAFAQAMLGVRRFAWDLSLYTTTEFMFVRLPKRYTTGSSIMPNKSNPDVVELLRAAAAPVQGAMVELMSLLSLTSGYHRDLQSTKEPALRAIGHSRGALALLPDLIASLEFDRARMRDAISPDMYATDRAVELTSRGVAFRDAYRQVAAELDQLEGRTPDQSLAARISPGAAGDLRLNELRDRLAAIAE